MREFAPRRFKPKAKRGDVRFLLVLAVVVVLLMKLEVVTCGGHTPAGAVTESRAVYPAAAILLGQEKTEQLYAAESQQDQESKPLSIRVSTLTLANTGTANSTLPLSRLNVTTPPSSIPISPNISTAAASITEQNNKRIVPSATLLTGLLAAPNVRQVNNSSTQAPVVDNSSQRRRKQFTGLKKRPIHVFRNAYEKKKKLQRGPFSNGSRPPSAGALQPRMDYEANPPVQSLRRIGKKISRHWDVGNAGTERANPVIEEADHGWLQGLSVDMADGCGDEVGPCPHSTALHSKLRTVPIELKNMDTAGQQDTFSIGHSSAKSSAQVVDATSSKSVPITSNPITSNVVTSTVPTSTISAGPTTIITNATIRNELSGTSGPQQTNVESSTGSFSTLKISSSAMPCTSAATTITTTTASTTTTTTTTTVPTESTTSVPTSKASTTVTQTVLPSTTVANVTVPLAVNVPSSTILALLSTQAVDISSSLKSTIPTTTTSSTTTTTTTGATTTLVIQQQEQKAFTCLVEALHAQALTTQTSVEELQEGEEYSDVSDWQERQSTPLESPKAKLSRIVQQQNRLQQQLVQQVPSTNDANNAKEPENNPDGGPGDENRFKPAHEALLPQPNVPAFPQPSNMKQSMPRMNKIKNQQNKAGQQSNPPYEPKFGGSQCKHPSGVSFHLETEVQPDNPFIGGGQEGSKQLIQLDGLRATDQSNFYGVMRQTNNHVERQMTARMTPIITFPPAISKEHQEQIQKIERGLQPDSLLHPDEDMIPVKSSSLAAGVSTTRVRRTNLTETATVRTSEAPANSTMGSGEGMKHLRELSTSTESTVTAECTEKTVQFGGSLHHPGSKREKVNHNDKLTNLHIVNRYRNMVDATRGSSTAGPDSAYSSGSGAVFEIVPAGSMSSRDSVVEGEPTSMMGAPGIWADRQDGKGLVPVMVEKPMLTTTRRTTMLIPLPKSTAEFRLISNNQGPLSTPTVSMEQSLMLANKKLLLKPPLSGMPSSPTLEMEYQKA